MPPRIKQITGVSLYFLPVQTRVPLKFGTEALTSVTCARVNLRVIDQHGRHAEGWGETPLSVQWVWPSSAPYSLRHERLQKFCRSLCSAWMDCEPSGHALELGHHVTEHVLPDLLAGFNECEFKAMQAARVEPMPWLAALVCNSPFDIALHDAYGKLAQRPVYETYGQEFLDADLAHFLESSNSHGNFENKRPSDFLLPCPNKQLNAWHLVGGLDPLDASELTGREPQDDEPVLLRDWIQRDGLQCLKVKLRGNDEAWDFQRLVKVGAIALECGIEALSADFNCTVRDPEYVIAILDRLKGDHPVLFDRTLYVEQPFPYDLEKFRVDVRGVSKRKPLFLDESAHDWRMIRLGRELGWTGVALKTCKTQTGALLSACWAKAHGMSLMVQDLTNPMLAQIPHLLLAANIGTIKGVETNAMQFYPAASRPEAEVHPGVYQRRHGQVNLSTISGPGFGYRLSDIKRVLPEPAVVLN
jgi:L-alanine-DL-glutamate epimerase-like enolase superfamily enzyme